MQDYVEGRFNSLLIRENNFNEHSFAFYIRHENSSDLCLAMIRYFHLVKVNFLNIIILIRTRFFPLESFKNQK